MITRSFDATLFNSIVNHPDVFPSLCSNDNKPMDLQPAVDDHNNFLLMSDRHEGCLFFHQQEPGLYEVHTQFMPKERKEVLKVVRQCLHYMFIKTDAMVLQTRVPVFNKGADALAQAIGGELQFERKNAWKNQTGDYDVKYYSLIYENWVKNNERLIKSGHWFHKRLESEKQRLGVTEPLHEDDECHNWHVGAAVEMMLAGQVNKSVILYNRWAKFSGYATVNVISYDPLIINQKDAWVHIKEEDFEVIKCL